MTLPLRIAHRRVASRRPQAFQRMTVLKKTLLCGGLGLAVHVLPAPGVLEDGTWPTTRDGYVKLDFSYPRGDIELVLTDGGACAFERELPTFLRLRTGQYDAESSAPYWQRDIGHA